MNYPYEETGKRIFMLRKERGLTRERLAEMADISVQFLADIEKGRKNMTVTTLRKLSAALMVTTDYVVNGSESPDHEACEDVLFLYNSLSPDNQARALKILGAFTEAVKK